MTMHIPLISSLWRRLWQASPFASLVLFTIGTNAFLAILGIGSGLVIARQLGPEGRGELTAIQSWPIFLSIISVIGLHDAIAYYSARFPEEATSWLGAGVLIALVASLIVVASGYYALPLLLDSQSPEVIQNARLYLWYLPLNVVAGLPGYALRGKNDLIYWNLHRSLPAVIWAVVVFAGFALRNSSPGLIARHYLMTYALVMLIVTPVLIWLRLPRVFRPSIAMISPMVRYGIPSVLSSAPSILNLRLDQLILAALVSPQILGLYVVGVSWGGAGSFIVNGLTAAILPKVASSENPETQKHILAQVTRVGLLLSMLIALLTVLAAPIAIPSLFGKEFANAVPAGIVLAVAAGILSFNQLLSTCVMGLGRPDFVLIAESAGFVATGLFLWLLLVKYQLIGAAWASLLSYLVTGSVLLVLIVRQTRLKARDLILPDFRDAAMLFGRLKSLRSAG
jgi:O-antigen/teichoic acid export membrane protein